MRAGAVLFALPGLTFGTSLSEFRPTLSGLSKNCNDLYTSTLPGCTATDFTTRHCSSSCLATLNTVTSVIHNVCSNENLHGINIISAFLDGTGEQKICINAPASPNASGSSGSSSPTSSSSQQLQETASTPATQMSSLAPTSALSTSSATAVTASAAPSTSANPPSGIEIDTTASPTVQSTTPPSATGTSQSIEHGGDPFDVSSNTNAAGRSAASMVTGVIATFAVALLGSLAI